jgi:UDP-N-acetylglucosamine 2-epimerase
MAKTLYKKTWDAHTVGTIADGRTQLFIGTHLIHEVTSPQAFGMIQDLGLGVKYPHRTFATVDHIVPTDNQQQPFADPLAEAMINELKNNVEEYGIKLGKVEVVDLMAYKEYLTTIYHCPFIISDSGTAQEEPAIFDTPVVVPRDFTERPQSVEANCSYMLDVNDDSTFEDSWNWLSKIESKELVMDVNWLGDGNTSELVVEKLKNFLSK